MEHVKFYIRYQCWSVLNKSFIILIGNDVYFMTIILKPYIINKTLSTFNGGTKYV